MQRAGRAATSEVATSGGKTSKMDGENHGKTLLKWMIWKYHSFWKHPFLGHVKGLVLQRSFFQTYFFLVLLTSADVWETDEISKVATYGFGTGRSQFRRVPHVHLI